MKLRKLAALIGAMALTFSAAGSVLATGFSVDICHASDSETNPYIAESPAVDSTGFLHGGHLDHTGPVWFPGAKAADVVWGDIIPPYDFDTGDGIFHFAGLNWTDLGQAILANGCNPVPAINVVKTASVDSLPAGGGDVTYTYVVTNTGQVALSNVTVTDDKCAPATLQSGDANSNSKLDLTETWTFTCSATITETTTNVGTATGHDGDHTVTDTDTKTVTVAPPAEVNPSISIDKTADPTTLPAGGGDITYTYVVTNTGDVALTDIVVSDDNGTPANTADDFIVECPHDALGVDENMTCTADVTGTTVTTTNIATVTAKAGETTVSDTDSATVTVAEGGVQGETHQPTQPTPPPTDALTATTTDAGGTLPLMLIVLGIIGLGAVALTPARKRR